MYQEHSGALPRRRSLETWSVIALITTLIASAIVIIPSGAWPFAATKSTLLAAGTIITLALYILARLSRGNVILPPITLLSALWLPALAYALSGLFSGVGFSAAFWGAALEPDTLGFVLVAAVLGTLAALVLRREEQYATFLKAGAYGLGAIILIEALVVVVGQFAPNTISPALSIVGSFSDLAFLLGLGVASALITLRFVEVPKRSRQFILVGGLLALILLVIANSSLVWTLLALVSLGLFVEAVMQRRSSAGDSDLDDAAILDEAPHAHADSAARPLTLPLIVLAVSLFFLIGGTLGGAVANALHINVLDVRPSGQSTLEVGKKVYSNSFVFGSGPGTFGTEWLKYRDATLNSTLFWNIDFTSGIGYVPTSMVTTGALGALAWIGLIALFVVLGLRMIIMRAPESPYVRYVSILSFVGMLYLFAAAVFGLPSGILLALGFVFAGLFASTMRFARGTGQWGVIFARSPRIGFVIVFALTLLLLGSVVSAYKLVGQYVASVQLAHANAALSAGNLDAADRAAANAITFAPSATAYEVQATIAATRLAEVMASSTMVQATAQQAFQAALTAGINAALTATRLAPSDYQSWMLLGNMYAQAVPLKVAGSYDSAKTAYERALALNPTNPQIPYTLAQLDIANKDNKAAQAHLKDAIALKQDYTAAIFLLSQLLVQDGNLKDALASAEAAAYFTPNDPNVLFQVGILLAASNDLPNAVQALSAAIAANPQFANAHYFLAAVYAKQGDTANALKEVQAIAALSADNAKAVESQIAALQAGRNPFPANLLSITPASDTGSASASAKP